MYPCACWRCVAGCALPDREVWPPPPTLPVVSSYSSFPFSDASGSELSGGEEEQTTKDVRKTRIFKRNMCVSIIHLLVIFLYLTSFLSIVVRICLLYFCVVSLLPDLLGSLHQEIWGSLKVLCAFCECLMCCWSSNEIFISESVSVKSVCSQLSNAEKGQNTPHENQVTFTEVVWQACDKTEAPLLVWITFTPTSTSSGATLSRKLSFTGIFFHYAVCNSFCEHAKLDLVCSTVPISV